MGAAVQTILAQKLNITGGSFEALTPGTGDSFALFSYRPGTSAWLIEAVAGNSTTKCQFRIRSPRMHDNVQGLRLAHMFNPTLSGADGDPQVLLPPYVRQPLYSSDTLTIEVNGTAMDDVDLALTIFYEDLPGVEANLRTWEEVSGRIVNTCGVLVAPTAGASNDYGTSVTLISSQDLLRSDTDYAILGAVSDLPATSLGIRGPDTGNLRVGIPLHWDSEKCAGWFVSRSQMYGLPLIPVIQANNRGATLIDLASSGGAIAPNVTLILGELAGF